MEINSGTQRGAFRFKCHGLTAILTVALCFGGAACKRHKRISVQTDEESPRLATMLSVADPRAGSQLVSGFYSLENNSWRWTAGKFTVLLRPPRTAGQKGATLKLKFGLPDPVMDRVKSITLSTSVNGTQLAPETYTKSGDYTFTRDVPASALNEEAVKVQFSLDKFLPSGAVERRELGIIVSMVGFEGK